MLPPILAPDRYLAAGADRTPPAPAYDQEPALEDGVLQERRIARSEPALRKVAHVALDPAGVAPAVLPPSVPLLPFITALEVALGAGLASIASLSGAPQWGHPPAL